MLLTGIRTVPLKKLKMFPIEMTAKIMGTLNTFGNKMIHALASQLAQIVLGDSKKWSW